MRANGLLLLCLVGSLIGCSGRVEVVRETVEVAVPVRVPLPAELLVIDPEPEPPELACLDRGRPTLCNEDLAEWLEQLRAWGEAGWSRVRKVAELQPERPER